MLDAILVGKASAYDVAIAGAEFEHVPNFDQPYNVELTYYDAIGTGYRTQRIGYLMGTSDFKLEEWNDDRKEWVTLV